AHDFSDPDFPLVPAAHPCRLLSIPSSRSRSTVFARAMSLRTWRIRAGFCNCPVAFWKRRLNSSSFNERSFCSISAVVSSASSLAFIRLTTRFLPCDELRLDRQLVPCQTQRFPGHLFRHAGQLKHHFTRLHHGDPFFRGTFPAPHPHFQGLLRHRLGRKDFDPDLSAPPDITGHRNPSGLDLPVGDPARLQGLQTVFAEGHFGAALGPSFHAAPVLLAKLGPLGHQHVTRLLPPLPSSWAKPRRDKSTPLHRSVHRWCGLPPVRNQYPPAECGAEPFLPCILPSGRYRRRRDDRSPGCAHPWPRPGGSAGWPVSLRGGRRYDVPAVGRCSPQPIWHPVPAP